MVKLADTLAPMGDFPVAEGKDVTLTKGDGTEKSIQKMYDDNELGGSGLPEPESKDKLLLSVENEETSELEWSQVDKGTIDGSAYVNLDVGSDLNTLVTHGRYRTTTKRVDRIENVPVQVAGMLTVRLTGSVIYQTYNSIVNKMYTRTSEDAGENWSDWKDVSEGGDEPFIGTKEEWEALSLEEKANYKIVNFTDDYTSGGSDEIIETGAITFTASSTGTLGANFYVNSTVSKSFTKKFSSTPTIIVLPLMNPNGNAILSGSVSATKDGITNVWLNVATNVVGTFGIKYVAIGN